MTKLNTMKKKKIGVKISIINLSYLIRDQEKLTIYFFSDIFIYLPALPGTSLLLQQYALSSV